jgi:hypothetical protein
LTENILLQYILFSLQFCPCTSRKWDILVRLEAVGWMSKESREKYAEVLGKQTNLKKEK